jgi:CheY-like chemotaxis protein
VKMASDATATQRKQVDGPVWTGNCCDKQANHFQILLAGDNTEDVEFVQETLGDHNVNCPLHVIRDGAHAIAYIDTLDTNQQTPPLDLLLLDMRLPKSDGEQVLKRLRSTGRCAQTPVIVMTGSASRAMRRCSVSGSHRVWMNTCSLAR